MPMAPVLKQIERQALSLSPEDREILAARLWHSLDDEPITEIDQAWIEEAERRFQDFKDGKTKGIPGGIVFDQIRQELGWSA